MAAVCAAGFGSHVKGWTTQQFPVRPPKCGSFSPGKDRPYTSNETFSPAGKAAGRCFCFRCPAGYTSKGGALNAADAQCRILPAQQLFVQLSIASADRGHVCNKKIVGAATKALVDSLKTQPGLDARTAVGQQKSCVRVDPKVQI